MHMIESNDTAGMKRVTVGIDYDVYRGLRRAAADTGLPPTDLVDRALRSYLGDLQADRWALESIGRAR